jgi:hypothetical protein
MQAELRKLAQALREKAAELEEKKLVKTAQVIRSAVGLKLLEHKIGRNR